MKLVEKKCQSCEGKVLPLNKKDIERFLKQLNKWSVDKEGHLIKDFKFNDFKETMIFLNKVADLAESENHHPNFYIAYNKIHFEIWTHAINGLSENDFILAAKIDHLK